MTDLDFIQIIEQYFIKYAHTDSQILMLKEWALGQDATLAARKIIDENIYWDIVKKVFSVSDSSLSKV